MPVAANGLVIVAALCVGMLLVAISGSDLASATQAVINGSVGSTDALRETLRQATPILIAGLGVAVALRARLFNIGAEGQLYLGALGGVLVDLYATWIPAGLRGVVVMLAGALAGAVWGGTAGWLRSRLRMNEVISTLMLNFIAYWFVSYLVGGPLRDPTAGGYYPWTRQLSAGSRIPSLHLGDLVVPGGLLIGLGLGMAVALVMGRTRLGFELRLLGGGEKAANFAGVPIGRRTIQAFAISGALAGVAGAIELAGAQLRLSGFFSPGYGFTAIAVALIGNASSIGVIFAGLFFGALTAGGEAMESIAQVPASIGYVVQGAVILFLVGARSAWAQAAFKAAGVRLRRRAVVDG